MKSLRVVAGGHDEGGHGVGSDSEEEFEEVGHGGDEEGFDPLVELG